MDLSKSVSSEERAKFVRERFRAGTVIKLFCDFTKPPKFKLLLVGSLQERPLLFVINSRATEFAKNNARLREQQVPISRATNDFLDHDSVIDCSTTYDNFTRREIEAALRSDTTLILGHICPLTASAVIESVSDSQTLSTIHMNQINMEMSARTGPGPSVGSKQAASIRPR